MGNILVDRRLLEISYKTPRICLARSPTPLTMANNYIDSDSESTTTATDSSGEPLLVTDDMYIGLNNAQLSSHRRSLLDLMNKLRSNGYDN